MRVIVLDDTCMNYMDYAHLVNGVAKIATLIFCDRFAVNSLASVP